MDRVELISLLIGGGMIAVVTLVVLFGRRLGERWDPDHAPEFDGSYVDGSQYGAGDPPSHHGHSGDVGGGHY